MGTTGTIMGCSRFFKEQNPAIQIIGVQPEEGAQIPGIRKWSPAYLPKIYDGKNVDSLEYVSQQDAEEMTRRLAPRKHFRHLLRRCLSVAAHLAASQECGDRLHRMCRGDRYLRRAYSG